MGVEELTVIVQLGGASIHAHVSQHLIMQNLRPKCAETTT
jgi:hypothetical protein